MKIQREVKKRKCTHTPAKQIKYISFVFRIKSWYMSVTYIYFLNSLAESYITRIQLWFRELHSKVFGNHFLRGQTLRGPRMGGWIRRGWIWRFWGAPIFSPEVPNPLRQVLWDLWTENRGAPKTPNSTTTDPTPHSRPSETPSVPPQGSQEPPPLLKKPNPLLKKRPTSCFPY